MTRIAGAGRLSRSLLGFVVPALLALTNVPRHAGAQQLESARPAGGNAQLLPVATRRLPRGKVLETGDMTLAMVTVRGLPALPAQRAVPGWVTRRVVLAGEVLREPAVAPMPLVSAGAPVQFEINQAGLRLSLDGVAMSAASLGGRVAVRLGAKRRVFGIVAGPARVIAIDSLRIS